MNRLGRPRVEPATLPEPGITGNCVTGTLPRHAVPNRPHVQPSFVVGMKGTPSPRLTSRDGLTVRDAEAEAADTLAVVVRVIEGDADTPGPGPNDPVASSVHVNPNEPVAYSTPSITTVYHEPEGIDTE